MLKTKYKMKEEARKMEGKMIAWNISRYLATFRQLL